MRITSKMMANTFLRDLYNNNADLQRYQNQLSSGDRILRPSDDPVGTARTVKVKNEIAATKQYRENVRDAKAILTETETAVSEVTNIINRMSELVGIGASDLYSQDQKTSSAQEILQLRDELIAIGNTNYSGQYIFGGYNTTKPPFVATDDGITYNGVDLLTSSAELDEQAAEEMQYKIDESTFFPVGVNGTALFGVGDENLYKILDDVADLMMNEKDCAKQVGEYKNKLNKALERNLSLVTEVGSRGSRLELVDTRYENDLLNFEEKRSNIADVDSAEAITNFKFAKAAYNTALAVGAQIVQNSLLDYLH